MSEEEKSGEEKGSSKGLKSFFELKQKSATSASAKKELALKAKISNQKKSKKVDGPNSSKFSKILLKEKTPENPAVTFKKLSEGTRIVEKYAIEEPYSNIQIVQPPELGGGKAYYIEEVKLEENEKLVLAKLFDIISKEIEPSKDVKNQIEQVSNEARRLALKYGLNKKITSESWNKILYYLHRNLVGYGDIDVIMKDSMIEDLSINGLGTPLYVWHRKSESVFVIGRYNRLEEEYLGNLPKKVGNLSIEYSTAHSSKGLEADYVIIVGLNGGRMGFPCQITDDPLLSLVLAEADPFPNAEERRLFYVAVTRAKKQVFLIDDPTFNSSSFLIEILNGTYDVESVGQLPETSLCPVCKTGEMVKKQNNRGTFYACSNYPYCEYIAHS